MSLENLGVQSVERGRIRFYDFDQGRIFDLVYTDDDGWTEPVYGPLPPRGEKGDDKRGVSEG